MPKKPIRPIRIDGDVAYIPLTRGREALIDIADIPIAEGFNWSAAKIGGSFYAVRRIDGKSTKNLYLHRQIMDPPEGIFVDHIDGNGLDCRRANMRQATRAQNGQNAALRRDNTSGLKGASFDRRNRVWLSYIGVKGKNIYLGRFDTAEDAHAAYCKASAELHGEFGRTK